MLDGLVVGHPDGPQPEHRHLPRIPIGQAVEGENLAELADPPSVPPGVLGAVPGRGAHRGEYAFVGNEIEKVLGDFLEFRSRQD